MTPRSQGFRRVARARASRSLDISRRLLYAKPTETMMAHALSSSRLRRRAELEFSGPVGRKLTV